MNRYVLAVLVNLEPDKLGACGGFETSRRIYDKLVEISSSSSSSELPPFPACSLSGSPGLQKCYFAVQMTYGLAQFCSAEWEEVCVERSDSEETAPSAVDSCISAVQDQEESESTTLTELFEEAAEALHQLADKLPPPGHFLLDVLMLCEDKEGLKEFLPVIGALKHMQAWHSALVNIVTEHSTGWRTAASYLSARVRSPAKALDCIDERELWRGGLWLRERKFVSELVFEGFSLKVQSRSSWSRVLNPERLAERKLHSEVFHYYQPVMELIQLVNVADFPMLLQSSTEFELTMSSRSARARLFYDQLRTLRGGMGALFALSCVISTEAFPPASQLSASRWRDFMSKRPKVLSVPEVELKGEKGHYLLLVQGVESGGCKARLMHSANQINGTVALGTINGLIRETLLSSSGTSLTSAWLQSLPRLHGEQLLHREKGVDRVQMRVLQEWLRRREEVQKPAALPLNELKVLLNLAREQYLNTQNTTLPRVSDSEPAEPKHTRLTQTMKNTSSSDWPERSVLRNYENMQKIRHRSRSSLFSGGSSDSLMGPKDGPKSGSAQLDARELLRHFTPDGLPAGELQPLPVLRGENAFQMSSDITPRKVTKLPFTQASSSHYHGLEYCLDERRALERDRGFVRLQSRLIRFETQTTCCREPCPLPLALSPAPTPSPAPPSETDAESLQSDPPQHKRRSREPDVNSHHHKRSDRLCKSESSESVCSQGSVSSVTHPTVRALRQQAGRSLSTSSTADTHTPGHTHADPKPTCSQPESRSQKHNRMLKEVVLKTLKHHGISSDHKCFQTCSRRLFDVSKLYLKDLKTSRGLHEEMKKAAGRNAKQVIDWVMEKDGL
ncbi:mdm2-binding protein isoform X2 [Astyanax mexicanus]|uniref:mdm2-binding protein isoform X2 n=1 Tax=Astyanax mexicanus TaxID=7994 RepID=UPI0020CB03E5|nr:mdm2-binding protein isoform X2 [Astyanax mexicanus]